jgi:hypothetical protein
MRRLISLISAFVAIVGLGLVLFNATTIDAKPPAIKLISLSAPGADPHLAQTLTAIDVEFSEPVRTATAEARFHIEPAIDGAFSWDGSTAIFTPSKKLPADSSFTISIAPGIEDLAGNVDEVGLQAWVFRTVGAPLVLRVTPADAATGVPLDGQVELVFDRLMDTASVEAAVSVAPQAPVTATWRGSVVTLDFGLGLQFGTTYTLTVGAQAADTGGSRLGEPFTTHFTTVGAGLGIATLMPSDGVAGIGVNTPIAIQFDAAIDPETARSALHIVPTVDGDIRIVARGGDLGSPASPQPSGAAPSDTILFVPSAPLAPHTTYTLSLDPTVARLDDPTAVSSGRTWSFTTGAPTTSGQNQVAFLSSRSGVRNVWVMNPDGTNQRQLTTELNPVSSFDSSADGGQLAFSAGGVVTIMSIDGTGLRRLTLDDGRLEYGPEFTPDDSHLLLARRDPGGGDLGFWLVPLPGTSGDERQVLDHGAPGPGSGALAGDGLTETGATAPWTPRAAIDPVSTEAAVVAVDGTAWIVQLQDPGTGLVVAPVEVPVRAADAPAWVAGRNGFVVAGTGTDGRVALYTIDLAGHATLIAGTDGAAGPVGLGPDGQLAVSVHATDGLDHLRVVDTTGTVRTLAGPAGQVDRWPAFSPDGGQVLVGRTLAAQPQASDGIWLLEVGSGVARQLTSDGAYARWIP